MRFDISACEVELLQLTNIFESNVIKMSNNLNLQDVRKSRKSGLWQHFLLSNESISAQRRIYQKVLKAGGPSTKGLLNQARGRHKIDVKTSQHAAPGNDSEPKAKISTIDHVLRRKEKSLGEVISRLIASDGLNFRQIANSYTIQRVLKKAGQNLPKIRTNVRRIFLEEYKLVRNAAIAKIQHQLDSGNCFSVSQNYYQFVYYYRFVYSWQINKNSYKPINANKKIKNLITMLKRENIK